MSSNRRRIFVRGLSGPFEVRQTDPILETVFSDVGFHESVVVNDVYEIEDIVDAPGNLVDSLPKTHKVTGQADLLQTSKVEIDIMRNAEGVIHAVRYSGIANNAGTFWHFLAFEQCRIMPGVDLKYAVGKRTLPLKFSALNQDDVVSDIPEYYFVETAGEIRIQGLQLWTEPRLDYQVGTSRLLDISAFLRHGSINSDFGTIWTSSVTPPRFLRLDGVNDQINFGNILSINSSDDVLIEKWVKIQGADASLQELLGKKAGSANEAGYMLRRTASNFVEFKISDGSTSATITTTATLLAASPWTLVQIAIDRNGTCTIYFNGSPAGGAASVAAVGNSSSSDNLLIGAAAGGFGQIDVGGMRLYNFGPGGLPADIATIVARHYNAEKAFYGL